MAIAVIQPTHPGNTDRFAVYMIPFLNKTKMPIKRPLVYDVQHHKARSCEPLDLRDLDKSGYGKIGDLVLLGGFKLMAPVPPFMCELVGVPVERRIACMRCGKATFSHQDRQGAMVHAINCTGTLMQYEPIVPVSSMFDLLLSLGYLKANAKCQKLWKGVDGYMCIEDFGAHKISLQMQSSIDCLGGQPETPLHEPESPYPLGAGTPERPTSKAARRHRARKRLLRRETPEGTGDDEGPRTPKKATTISAIGASANQGKENHSEHSESAPTQRHGVPKLVKRSPQRHIAEQSTRAVPEDKAVPKAMPVKKDQAVHAVPGEDKAVRNAQTVPTPNSKPPRVQIMSPTNTAEALTKLATYFDRPVPQLYLRLATVSRQFSEVFMSDKAWRQLDVHGVETRIAQHYLKHKRDLMSSQELQFCAQFNFGAWTHPAVSPEVFLDFTTYTQAIVLTESFSNREGLAGLIYNREAIYFASATFGVLHYASPQLTGDDRFMKKCCARNGCAIYYASKHLKDDEATAAMAIRTYSRAVLYLSDRLQADVGLTTQALALCGSLLELMPASIRGNKQAAIVAITHTAAAFAHCSEALRGDAEVARLAVRRQGTMLAYASEALRGDYALVKDAIKQDPAAFQYAGEAIKLRIIQRGLAGG